MNNTLKIQNFLIGAILVALISFILTTSPSFQTANMINEIYATSDGDDGWNDGDDDGWNDGDDDGWNDGDGSNDDNNIVEGTDFSNQDTTNQEEDNSNIRTLFEPLEEEPITDTPSSEDTTPQERWIKEVNPNLSLEDLISEEFPTDPVQPSQQSYPTDPVQPSQQSYPTDPVQPPAAEPFGSDVQVIKN